MTTTQLRETPGVTRMSFSGQGAGAALTNERIARARVAMQDRTTAIVLEGDAHSFCTGLDLDGFAEAKLDLAADSRQFGQLLAALAGARVPVIAMVEGEALGGGLGLVAVADYVVAHPRARFGLPESMLGLIPAMVFPWIQRRAGLSVTRRLALGGAPLSAPEAFRFGLVDEISDEPRCATTAVLDRLGKMDTRSIAEIKRLIGTHYPVSASWLADSAASFAELASSDTTRQRIERFVACEAPWEQAR